MVTSFSENEINYIEELKKLLIDGVINDDVRKMLDRYAVKFKIDKEKQIIIDNVFIK